MNDATYCEHYPALFYVYKLDNPTMDDLETSITHQLKHLDFYALAVDDETPSMRRRCEIVGKNLIKYYQAGQVRSAIKLESCSR